MYEYLDNKQQSNADAVIHWFIVDTQAKLIKQGHPIAASIDVNPDFLEHETAGYHILVPVSMP
jgi:hypothetical protein